MIIRKQCTVCNRMRKFIEGTPRDAHTICGECWDWEKTPKTSDDERVINADPKDLKKFGIVPVVE